MAVSLGEKFEEVFVTTAYPSSAIVMPEAPPEGLPIPRLPWSPSLEVVDLVMECSESSEGGSGADGECGAKPEVAQTPKPVFPPWELAKPEYEHRYAEGASKKADSALATTLAREKIEQRFSQHLKIYTDGSVLDSGEVGCAFVIPDLGITRRYKLNAGLSIFSAEMYAILMACTFVNDMPNPPLGVVILSDSKSSLQALERGGTRNRSDVQSEILFLAHQIITKGTILALMWLPSHSGIRGNELADRAARDATGDGMEAKLLQTLSEPPDIRHIVNGCDGLPASLQPIWDLRDRYSLKT
nr:hypothetical protein BaRGS_026954 [Batillaria attramentaria]